MLSGSAFPVTFMLDPNMKSLILLFSLLLTNTLCYSVDNNLNGNWRVNTGATKDAGFPGESWDIVNNNHLIDAVKSMTISIDDTNVTMSVTSNGTTKTENVIIIKRSVKQIIVMGSDAASRFTLISAVDEKTIMLENGQFFRVYFSKQ
jgi:hypothetical protein